jgi:putative transposase
MIFIASWCPMIFIGPQHEGVCSPRINDLILVFVEEPRGWYSRGYLPHIDAGEQPQFVTFRLADSLPATVLERWHIELEGEVESARRFELYRRCERYLDEGHGSCTLSHPVAARIVQDALVFYHGIRYLLHNWVVMPNHVHMLMTPTPGTSLESILKPLKSFTSLEIHKQLGGQGRLWQADYFDRLMRDLGHFDRTALYIEWNPVKAKLCTDKTHWPYSSANPSAMARLERVSS